MTKWVKIGFPIVCIAVVGGTLIAIGNLKSKAEEISKQRELEEYENSINYSNSYVSDDSTNYSNYNYQYDYGNNEIDYSKTNTNTNSNIHTNTNLNTNTNKNNTNENTNKNVNNNTNVNNSNKNVASTNSNLNSEETEDLDSVSDKEKAIKLVAEEWGEDSSVYYTNEGVSSGYYIVAVRDKSNTSVKMFYKVDVNNNTVEVDW